MSRPSENELGDLVNSVENILHIWTHNRTVYPGWLAVPGSVRHSLSQNTEKWEPLILKVLPSLAEVKRLKAIRELVWRREIMLDPISQQLEESAQGVLEEIDCQGPNNQWCRRYEDRLESHSGGLAHGRARTCDSSAVPF